MGGTIKIRLVNDLWWSDVSTEEALQWNNFSVININEDFCYVTVNRKEFEMKREDYNKLLDSKAFRLKFNIKKWSFSN
jgi:hypothetical protein